MSLPRTDLSSAASDAEIVLRAFGGRARVVGPLGPASRADQRRRLAAVALTTTIPAQCHVEVAADGTVARAWLDGKQVSTSRFWRRFVAARRAGRPTVRKARAVPDAPRRTPRARRRSSRSARAAPAESSQPPSSTAACPCEGNARAFARLLEEVRALRAEVSEGRSAAPKPARANSPSRRRPQVPMTVMPTDIDRARARAALKRSGWKPVR
jgi:hypothetical protein